MAATTHLDAKRKAESDRTTTKKAKVADGFSKPSVAPILEAKRGAKGGKASKNAKKRNKARAAQGKQPKVSQQQQEQQRPESDKAKRSIFLRKLHRDRTKDDIVTYYKRLGDDAVRSIRWSPTSIKCAYVTFNTPEYASQALQLPGPTIRGKMAVPEEFDYEKVLESRQEVSGEEEKKADVPIPSSEEVKRPKRTEVAETEVWEYPQHPGETEYKMFVGKCPDSITDGHIYDYYSSLGDGCVTKVSWVRPQGNFRGFGFAWFKDSKSFDAALSMPPPKVDGRTLAINPAGYKPSPFQLFIGGLKGTGKTIFHVNKYYNQLLGAGSVTGCRELLESDGSSRGAGFLAFASQEMVDRALQLPPPKFGDYTIKVEQQGQASAPNARGKLLDRQLVITKCPDATTEEDIRSHYSALGPHAVERIDWSKDRKTVFIVFATPKFMQKALDLGGPVVDFHVLVAKPTPWRGSNKG